VQPATAAPANTRIASRLTHAKLTNCATATRFSAPYRPSEDGQKVRRRR
jgi:hypothetical protein